MRNTSQSLNSVQDVSPVEVAPFRVSGRRGVLFLPPREHPPRSARGTGRRGALRSRTGLTADNQQETIPRSRFSSVLYCTETDFHSCLVLSTWYNPKKVLIVLPLIYRIASALLALSTLHSHKVPHQHIRGNTMPVTSVSYSVLIRMV